MELARTSMRQGRRRRVTRDEPSTASPPRRTRRRRRDDRYALVLHADGTLPVGRFLPYTGWAVALSLVAGLLVAWGTGAGFLCQATLESRLGVPLPWLDLQQPASLATWLHCTSLSMCVTWAAFVYQLRRHRIDDYRGHYRIWIWIAALWGFASFDAIVGMHRTCGELVARYALADASPTRAGAGLVYGLIGLPLGVRLLREVWECRWARGTLLAAALAYSLGLIPGVADWLSRRNVPWPLVALVPVANLWGNWLTWSTCAFYARHVRLEMEGRSRSRLKIADGIEEDEEQESGQDDESAPKIAVTELERKKSETKTVEKASDTAAGDSSETKANRAKSSGRRWFWPFGKKSTDSSVESNGSGRTKRAKSAKVGPQDESSAVSSKSSRISEGTSTSTAVRTGSDRSPAAVPPADTLRMHSQGQDADDDADDDDLQHLSKAERKKLRREQRKLRNAA